MIDEPETDSTCQNCPDEPSVLASGDMEPPASGLGPESSGLNLASAGGSPSAPVAATGVRARAAVGKTWMSAFTIRKYRNGESEPYEVLEVLENIALNAGLALMLDLLIGAGGVSFAHSNARICVGNGIAKAVKTQTDLQGSSKLRKLVDTSFPSRSGQTLTFQATFGSSDANFHWQEWAIANSASGATVLNRKVEDMGTKDSGETWIATATIRGN